MPYQWGPNVLMYNTGVFKDAPKSWNVVFEEQTLPDGKSNKGRVQAYDGAIYIADAALYLMAKKPELGIKDPYELNEDQYKAALDVLRKQHALIQRYWHDANAQVDDFKNEGVVASGSWPFQVNLLQSDKRPIASTVPDEGATGWADTTMMAAGAKHPNCAYHVARAFAAAEGPGRRRRMVRLAAGGSRRMQGQRAPDRRRLQDQRLRQFQPDQVLEDAGRQVRIAVDLRPVLPLGHRLHRRDRRPVTSQRRQAPDDKRGRA